MWAQRAADYRKSGVRIDENIAYGQSPREKYDLIWPDSVPVGLAVFVHGGYWMRLSKSDWSDLAEGARSRGWAVCLPSYTLAPEVRIAQITRQITQAITHAAAKVPGPIRLSGHSAGGHLVSRMISDTSPLSPSILKRIEHTLSISGLHDLRPLLRTEMNETLHLDLVEATAESPVLLMPQENAKLTCWVGGGELPEFIRQAHVMAQIWEGLGANTAFNSDGSHNHFTVVEALKDPNSPLTACFVG